MHDERDGTGRGALRPLMLMAAALLAGARPAGAATRGFTITSFDQIRVDAPVTVVITTGTGVSARADGAQDALDRLHVDVSGRLAIISMDKGQPGAKSPGPATLRLSTGDVNRVVLTGGGAVTVSAMKGLNGEIVQGGNGDVSVASVQLDNLQVTLAGGGRTTLTGTAGVANLRISGPGAIAADRLVARQAAILNDGPGTVALAANGPVSVRSTGSGDVSVTGKPVCTVENEGTGRIQCGAESY
ncbi:DUF2807 domain-containing protein [Sphingobium sp. AP49]|uniref:GIN domain-containing protein n=1 Tax=Sphingobium sp. AP49 TaxID=1144307 RepID=UPI00026ECF2F|nr:DUF2807 domain-containing protein [Sphingobium sp. AP49]WHO40471.1 DUF2807 domain-containing protein [Sphingobium sp. AP49]